MDYDTTDREPTITDIKSRLAYLNADINKLATTKPNENQWNIPNMTQATLLSKYNNRDYTSGARGVAAATSANWWGFPGQGGWGSNLFPNDIAWWIANSDYTMNGTLGYFYYVYNSPVDKRISVYWVVDNDGVLKVNGNTIIGATNLGGGFKVDIDIKAGKNVFEFECINYGGQAGFVFYAYEISTNRVLFKSGPGWGLSSLPVPDYNRITNNKEYLHKSEKQANDSIRDQISYIRGMIKKVTKKLDDNTLKKDSKILPLLSKIRELQVTYDELVEKAKIPNYFDDSEEVTKIQAISSFNKYVWYLIFFILFFIAFFFILKKPEAGNLDMFMLALGVCILIYYAYNYYEMKNRANGNSGIFNMGWIKTMFNQSK